MKLSVFIPAVAIGITGCIALPAALPTSTQVPVAQDPSPPRPFPAGRIVEVEDPSPPRPFPKYPLEGGNPLEQRDPSALSRFPTDGENVANDPSPPRPFPAGRLVDVEDPSPLKERDPSAPHTVVEIYTKATDPSPPSPFPKYALDGGNPLEGRDPLSRFPTDGVAEADDPSPPRPFPAGRVVEEQESSPSDIISPRNPSPLLRAPEGSEAEANDPSPPRPFPGGRIVDTNDTSSGDAISPRTPSPLLRTPEGSEAEANDPSPPRPFPAGHPEDNEPRAYWPLYRPIGCLPLGCLPWPWSRPPVSEERVDVEARGKFPPHHGGHFPPSNPPVPEPTAPAMDIEARGDFPSHHGGYFPPSNPPVPEPTAPAVKADHIDTDYKCPHPCPPNMFDCCWPVEPDTQAFDTKFTIGPEYFPSTETPAPLKEYSHGRRPSPQTTLATTTKPNTPHLDAVPTTTESIDPTRPTIHKAMAMAIPTPCTTTYTSFLPHHLNLTGTATAHAATVTSPLSLDCGACALEVTTVDMGNGPLVNRTARPTVTDAGTTTEWTAVCSPSDIL